MVAKLPYDRAARIHLNDPLMLLVDDEGVTGVEAIRIVEVRKVRDAVFPDDVVVWRDFDYPAVLMGLRCEDGGCPQSTPRRSHRFW